MGVRLELRNLVSPQLVLLSKEFEKLEVLTVSLNKELKALSVDTSGLRALTTATNATNRAFERANVSASALRNNLASIHQTSRAMSVAGGIIPLPGGRGGAGAGGAGGSGGGSGGGHGRGMHGGNVLIGPKGIGLGAMGFAAGDWFWPLAATGAGIYAGKSLFDAALDLNTEQNRFRQLGLSEPQNQEAFNFVKGMNIYGTTQVDRMRAFREAQGVFRESGLKGPEALAGAKLAAPILAKLDFLASSLDDESKAKMHTANINMLRYVESSGGLKSAAEFNRIADFGYKLNVSSSGTVDWSQLRQFKARAGAAGFHLTDDALARLEPVIAELKGGAVGFGLSTAFNRLVGATRAPNQVVGELLSTGIWDRSRVELNKLGGIKRFTSARGPLSDKYAELLLSNPELFYESAIRPIYQKLKLSATDIARQNVMLFGTTGGRNMTMVENALDRIHLSISSLAATKGIEPSGEIAKGALAGNLREFTSAWVDFKTDFGTSMLPFFVEILKAGSSVLRVLPEVGEGAGGGLYKLLHHNYDPNEKPGTPVTHFAGKGGTSVQVHTTVNLDGKKVGNIVSGHIARSLPTGDQTGPSGYDPGLGRSPSGSP